MSTDSLHFSLPYQGPLLPSWFGKDKAPEGTSESALLPGWHVRHRGTPSCHNCKTVFFKSLYDSEYEFRVDLRGHVWYHMCGIKISHVWKPPG